MANTEVNSGSEDDFFSQFESGGSSGTDSDMQKPSQQTTPVEEY
jgi:hypothetical protein